MRRHQTTLQLDQALVKEYFPVSFLVPAVLEIYQNLLSVRFEEVKNGSTWHEGMQAPVIPADSVNGLLFRCSAIHGLGEGCHG